MISRFQKRLLTQSHAMRRKRFIRRLTIYTAFIAALGIAASWFLTSDRFRIRELEIEEPKQTDGVALRRTIEIWLAGRDYYVVSRNILWVLQHDALKAEILRSFPTVRDVRIVRDLPGTLRVQPIEYDAWGVLCYGEPERCFWIDREGMAFEHAPEFSGVIVPKIHDNRVQAYELHKKYLPDNLMKLITYFNERAVSDRNLQSLQFIIDAKDETLRVRTRAGWDILLLESNDPEDSYKNLRVALDGEIKNLASDLEYIDLRFGNRLFYKFKE